MCHKYLLLLILFVMVSVARPASSLPYQVYDNPWQISSTVFEDVHYNHNATVVQYGNKIYVAWNGNRYNSSESKQGQVIMLRTSDDGGQHWSRTFVPFVKEYRALDELQEKVVDANPGDADDNHKIRLNLAFQWQPSLTVFQGKLLMFWSQDRFAEGSGLMMSVLDSSGEQWRSNELHFKADGSPYMIEQVNAAIAPTSDPTDLILESFGHATKYSKILGAESLPGSLQIQNISPVLLKAENLGGGGGAVSMPVSLTGHHLTPFPNQAAVLRDRNGNEVLSVALILLQRRVDWNNLAVKIPALLTTTDLVHWQLSIVPLKDGTRDFLGHERGDVGLISAWEPTVNIDRNGNFHMEFRLNLPPRQDSGADPVGDGFRSASSIGTFTPGVGVRWGMVHAVDLDVPASRATIARIASSHRWVMAQNHAVQGVSYDVRGVPVFNAERYELWPRQNISLFFSTRGDDDFIAGPNMSGAVEEAGKEVVHYPYIQSATVEGNDELLLAYSSHRRESVCTRGKMPTAPVEACHDSIQFVRIRDLPEPNRPSIYPNQFARYFKYGKANAQSKTYSYSGNILTLHDRGSAGIETWGNQGCINLRFKWNGRLWDGEIRPVLSFGRTSNRANIIGLSIRGAEGAGRLMFGERAIGGQLMRNKWTDTKVCYDFDRGRLVAGGLEWLLGAGGLEQRSYLGDPTLVRRENTLPDLSFDVGHMSLETVQRFP